MKEFQYSDILNYEYPNFEIERDFPDKIIRAAQFAPFAALAGYDEAVKESARETSRKIETDEYEKAELDIKLNSLNRNGGRRSVEITYFKADEKKLGGEYKTVIGTIKRVEEYERKIILEDGTKISMDDILTMDEK